MKAYIGIGTNLGDKEENIRRAVAALGNLEGVADIKCSAVFKSAPWGFKSENEFANLVVALEFPKPFDPLWLLDRCQEIERSISPNCHRDDKGNYIDRIIDIDIIAIDDRILRLTRLSVPHPLMHQRPFVLKPMLEVAPDWQHPILKLSIPEMLNNLEQS